MNKIINTDNTGNIQNKTIYKFFPMTKTKLQQIIKQQTDKYGNKVDLNNINVSKITDMSHLFQNLKFNGNISEWDVSNVTDMYAMFASSLFNGDISKWNVSNVINMSAMFFNSKFNQDIPDWNVSNVTNMSSMFEKTTFNGDISK